MSWQNLLLSNEGYIRISAFLSIFVIIAMLEILRPKRTLRLSKKARWLNNIGLSTLNTVILRLIFPMTAVMVGAWTEQNQFGLFYLLGLDQWLQIILAFILLDLLIYTQHVVFHLVPMFWRLHRLHHSDLDYDLTMASRFHSIEMVLSMILRCIFIVLIGAPAVAVLVFEIVLNGAALFNHGNISLPKKLDKVLRLFIVTPDMHFVHHSVIAKEHNSNFGFNLPWWDRLFGTYRAEPEKGQKGMEIGLKKYPIDRPVVSIFRMLLLPFEK